jgi:hypothetical protein
VYEQNRVLPSNALDRAGLAQAIGASEHTVRGWLTRGPLKPFPREPGVYTRSDVAVGKLYVALQGIFGEKSETVTDITEQIAARVWNDVKAGGSRRYRLSVRANGVTLSLVFELNDQGEIVPAAA